MKTFFVVLFLILLCAGDTYFYFPLPKPTKQEVFGPRGPDITSAARIQLGNYARHTRASISTLIVGEESLTYQNAWNFRGALKTQTVTRAIFGSIQNICSDFKNTKCWRLTSLAVEGEYVSLVADENIKINDNTLQASSSHPGDDEVSTQIDAMVEEISEEGEHTIVETETIQEELASPPEIWYSKTNNVNGRTGPGQTFPVAFKVPSRVPLTFVKKQGSWGLFSYPAEGGDKGEIWVFMNLVEQR